MTTFGALVRRDIALATRRGGDAALTLVFFVVAVAVFPFGVGPDPDLLARIAAGIIWVTALLASMTSLERLYRADLEDGSLEIMALSAQPLELQVAAKCFAHWLTSGLPVVVLSPLMAMLLHLDVAAWWILVVSLAVGTPVLSLVGSIGGALVLGARKSGALIGLIVLPLQVPVMIFGIGAVEAALRGGPVWPPLLIEAAILIAGTPLALWASAVALRMAIE